MTGIIEWLKGKKTYIIMGVTFVLGGLAAVGIAVPEWVFAILLSLGLGAARAGSVKE